MSDYDSLVRQRSSTQSQMYATQENNAALQEQIDRLETAKNLITSEKSRYYTVYLNAQNIVYGYYQWKGENFNNFYLNTEDVLQESSSY